MAIQPQNATVTTLQTLRELLETQTARAAELRKAVAELAALETNIELLGRAIELFEQELEPGASAETPKTLFEAIEGIADGLDGAFDINDVQEALRETYPALCRGGQINPTTVSGALRKLTERGQLELVEPGRGKRAARYRSVRVGGPQASGRGPKLRQQTLMHIN